MKKDTIICVLNLIISVCIFLLFTLACAIAYEIGYDDGKKSYAHPVETTSAYSGYSPEWKVAETQDLIERKVSNENNYTNP